MRLQFERLSLDAQPAWIANLKRDLEALGTLQKPGESVRLAMKRISVAALDVSLSGSRGKQ